MEGVQRGSRLLSSRKLGTIFLGLILAIAILALRHTLVGSWYQNLGYLHLSRAFLAQESRDGELASAHASFAQAVSWQENNSRARWGQGQVYHQLGDDASAVEQWRRSEGALFRLLTASDAAFKAEDYAEALDQALLALALDPNSSSAHYRVGEAHRGLGEPDGALSQYQRAKELNSFLPSDTADLASCYFGEARVNEALRNWDAAVWHYEVGLELRPDAPAYAGLGSIYHYQLRDPPTAAVYLLEAIELDPTEPWWHIDLGRIFLDQERYEQGLSELETALKLEDWVAEAPYVHVYLGRAYYGMGRFQSAVRAYQEALALDRDNQAAQEGLEEVLKSAHGEKGQGS